MIDGRKKRINKEIGNNLKRVREEKGISLRDLAASAGVEHSHIFRIEKGSIDPKATTLVMLAEALKVDVTEFWKGVK